MKKLTQEMVIARTKISDMSKIKRLNCWGSELVDVSLLRNMTNVEVLSLSINSINGLSDFAYCQQLQELYVRQNAIRDLNQVCYLQALTNLRYLWLGQNPCAEEEGYRFAVIRALPQLQKLDNVAIQPEELAEALRRGRVLVHPEEQQPEVAVRRPAREQQYPSPVTRSPTWQEEYEQEDPADYYEEDDRKMFDSPPRQSPPRRQVEHRRSYSPDQESQPVYYEDRRNANSYDQESPRQQYYDRSPVKDYVEDTRITPDSPRDMKMSSSNSTNSVKDYTNGDRHHAQSQYRQHESSDGSNHSHSGAYDPPRRERERCEKNSCPANHRPPFNRRPVTRNSNILSAVLCLVKELDYPSLEVVEMAVRCRMDELED